MHCPSRAKWKVYLLKSQFQCMPLPIKYSTCIGCQVNMFPLKFTYSWRLKQDMFIMSSAQNDDGYDAMQVMIFYYVWL